MITRIEHHIWIVDVSEPVFYQSSYVASDLPAWKVPQFEAMPQPGSSEAAEDETPTPGAKHPEPADEKATDQGPLSGTWQVSGGAKFRIVDDGKALTVSLAESDALREFAGKLTRRGGEADSKSFTGTLQAVFRADAPKRHSISVTATLDESGELHLRCSNWPAGMNRGKVITRTLNETWTRSNDRSRVCSSPGAYWSRAFRFHRATATGLVAPTKARAREQLLLGLFSRSLTMARFEKSFGRIAAALLIVAVAVFMSCDGTARKAGGGATGANEEYKVLGRGTVADDDAISDARNSKSCLTTMPRKAGRHGPPRRWQLYHNFGAVECKTVGNVLGRVSPVGVDVRRQDAEGPAYSVVPQFAPLDQIVDSVGDDVQAVTCRLGNGEGSGRRGCRRRASLTPAQYQRRGGVPGFLALWSDAIFMRLSCAARHQFLARFPRRGSGRQ